MSVVNAKPPAGAGTRACPLPPLNRDQENALAAAQGVLFGSRKNFLIEGQAGVGKTRLIVELVKRWPGRVAVCAPTHKAAAVLREMLLADPTLDVAAAFTKGAQRREAPAPYRTDQDAEAVAIALGEDACQDDGDDDGDQARVAVGTVHSLLALRPVEDDHGKERLVLLGGGGTAGRFSLIIVDEGSMIDSALQCEIDVLNIPVLFVGDRGQLPPIGEAEASCFNTMSLSARVRLVEIVRQHKSNPILQIASGLRDQQGYPQAIGIDTAMLHNLPPWRPDQPGVFDVEMGDIFAAFRARPDRCRMLAYTNAATIEHNVRIREAVLGRTATPFIAGERCLVRSPVIALSKRGEQSILIPVNSEPTVLSIHADTIGIEVGGPLWKGRGRQWPARTLSAPVWRLVLLHDGVTITCNIERRRGLRDNWMSYTTRAKRWDDRWKIRAALSDIRHLYSITAHTSQGSTYDTVFVDARDLLLGGMADRMTRLKLLYTAATRPSLQLGVYWEPQGFV